MNRPDSDCWDVIEIRYFINCYNFFVEISWASINLCNLGGVILKILFEYKITKET